MNLLWLLCCQAPPAVQQTRGEPAQRMATEAGRYRVAIARQQGALAVQLSDASGRAIEDAALSLVNATSPADLGVLVDPGECDSEGPARCLHPDGRYLLYIDDARLPDASWLQIDAQAGPDRVRIVRGLLTAPDR